MDKRKLGRTELEVSVVGFGAMTIGGMFGPVDDAVSNKALHAAIDAGMNFIDSSIGYGDGKSEEVIGRFLKERKDRDQIVICTKGGSNMTTGERSYDPDYVQKCAVGSLKRLGVEVIDVYLLHNPALENMKAADSFDLLEKYKEQGKIKSWGVSVNTVEECEYAVSNGRPDVLQMEYNVFLQEPAAVFADGKRENMGVISRVPLKRGLFSERVTEKTQYSQDDRRKSHLGPEKLPDLLIQRKKIEEVAKSLGCSLAELAIRFCVSNPDVATVIPGIRTPEQAKENGVASELLPEEILEKLRQIS
jgi:aryl-alcohol dehydrogenase-like predicted oxidoreductase